MARGGRRQGTPGKAYTNRSDLNTMRAPQQGTATAAAGGVTPPPAHNVSAPASAPLAPPRLTPDDTPNLTDPGNPSVPMTSGLATGAGSGYKGPSPADEVSIIAKYLPSLQEATRYEGAPDSFKALVRFLQGQ